MTKMVYTIDFLSMDEIAAIRLNIQINNGNQKELTNTDSNVRARVAKGETEGSTEC